MRIFVGFGMVVAGLTFFSTPAAAQECSRLDGMARTLCQAARNQGVAQREQQDQERKKEQATVDPAVAIRQEEMRIIDASMDCNQRLAEAGRVSRGGVFPECDVKRRADEAALDKRREEYARIQRDAQAGESSFKFFYDGKYYVSPAVLQSLTMGVGNFGDVVGKDIVVGAVPVTQVDSRGGKYWAYSGSTVVCISDAPVAIASPVPVSLRGRLTGTVVSTVSRNGESAQTNTVVIDNCRVGPPEDTDQVWARARGPR